MHSYIAILRGINVSGQKKIRMEDLRELLNGCGFKNLQTYIQSGNVVFQSEMTDQKKVSSMIADAIKDKYDFDVPVILREAVDLDYMLNNNPFLSNGREKEKNRLYVTFLDEKPAQAKMENINQEDYKPDEFQFQGREVYLYVPVGYGKTKLSNNFFENKLKVTATTRNWNTVKKLVEMSKSLK